MIYKKLGKSGLRVSPIGLGTMQFGWTTDEKNSFEVMDAYYEAGGNFIDTADIYTVWTGSNAGGVSEEIIGKWMMERGNREEIVLSTKVRGPMGLYGEDGRKTRKMREGLSRKWIMQACEDSMNRLQVDYIDLYHAHWVDNETPIEETLSAFTDLVRSGYVRYIACSNYSAWRLMQALWTSDTKGYESFVSVQPEYSMVTPTRPDFEKELARVCETYELGVTPWSPLAGGFLTGKYRRDQPMPESQRAGGMEGRFSEQNWKILDEILAIAAAQGRHPAQIALAWQLHKPFITAPIIGANTVAQLNDLLPAADVVLSAEEMKRLDDASSWNLSRTEKEV